MNRFEKILLTLFFVELFVGGGGRLIDFGFLSIRQVLFILLIMTFVVRIISQKAIFDARVNTFFRFNPLTIGVYLLIASFAFSGAIGLINNHAFSDIITDFFRVSFFAAYFPLAYYIAEDRFSKDRVISLLKYSAVAVSIFTLVIAILGKTIFSADFAPYYYFINGFMNDDLYFRPSNSVFYKSHIFVLIAVIISLNAVLDKKFTKLDVVTLILGSISVLWSETRGFLLAFMISVMTIVLLDARILTQPIKGFSEKIRTMFTSKKFLRKMIISACIVVAVPFMFQYMTLERFETETPKTEETKKESGKKASGEKKKKPEPEVNDISVNTRVEDILEARKLLADPVHLIMGLGYGTEIGGRVTGIEMSMLDILVEQGLVGLAVWLVLCLLVFYNYHVVYQKRKSISTMEISLMAAFMGMLLLTNINPFINNPLGIGFFLFILIVSQNRKEKESNGELAA
ncbi:hypothetical protein [Niallia endozanthoxylica]|uniref:Uncharacterized protein n=1 Tax=Niallia endozanthoxylica TaxID=2036016 RepID=A0A5J5HN18_9BACI|nr:hypothetical protein [Niallia endozanthoxylica]KAA9022077.1 hypothetical protein F4V44_16330 [Niallia endozanthoxylica]